jgi:predicted permease
MSEIIGISFPLFALIALGFFAHRRHLVNDETPAVLITFVYYFLLPPFLFMKIIDADVNQGLDIRILLAYYLAVGIIFFISYTSSYRMYSHDRKIVAIRSIASIAANTGYLGLPIIVLAYGNQAIIPGVAIVLLDNLIVLVGGSLLLEAAGSHGVRWRKVAMESLAKIVRNPLIVSIVLGMLYVLLVGVIPNPIRILGKTMADATLPCALFALGATLAQRRTAGHSSVDRYHIVALKLFMHPLLAFLFARFVFQLADPYVAIIVVMAAMPVSVNTFIMASRYNSYVKEISSILFMTTSLSIFIVTALLFAFS